MGGATWDLDAFPNTTVMAKIVRARVNSDKSRAGRDIVAMGASFALGRLASGHQESEKNAGIIQLGHVDCRNGCFGSHHVLVVFL